MVYGEGVTKNVKRWVIFSRNLRQQCDADEMASSFWTPVDTHTHERLLAWLLLAFPTLAVWCALVWCGELTEL